MRPPLTIIFVFLQFPMFGMAVLALTGFPLHPHWSAWIFLGVSACAMIGQIALVLGAENDIIRIKHE